MRLKHVAWSCSLLALALLFPGCGKDGDPGPQGTPGTQGATGAAGADGKSSFQLSTDYGNIQGTITGIRNDGTAFSEPFDFNACKDKGGIENGFDGHYLALTRYGQGSNNKMSFYLSFEKNQMSYSRSSTVDFQFFKEITGNSAFRINGIMVNHEISVAWPIDPYLNDAKYHFIFNTNGDGTIRPGVEDSQFGFRTSDGSEVRFNSASGAFIQIKNADGTVSTTSPVYSKIRLIYSAPYYYFIDEFGVSLASNGVIPADRLEIQNYTYDDATGSLKFTFKMQLEGFARDSYTNSTQHPLTVSGKVDVNIYSGLLSRTGN